MKLPVFLLTGGPGAGKTESRIYLKNALEKAGIHLVFVPESATELITGGLGAADLGDEAYQQLQISLQLQKEAQFLRGAREWMKNHPGKRCVMICDRGIPDGAAWCSKKVFEKALAANHLDWDSALNRYDAVFHLETAAKESSFLYSTGNNPARIADGKQAVEKDDLLLKICSHHPHQIVIAPGIEEKEKMDRLAMAVLARLDADSADNAESPSTNR